MLAGFADAGRDAIRVALLLTSLLVAVSLGLTGSASIERAGLTRLYGSKGSSRRELSLPILQGFACFWLSGYAATGFDSREELNLMVGLTKSVEGRWQRTRSAKKVVPACTILRLHNLLAGVCAWEKMPAAARCSDP
jgi:hypothetical protein